jgi:hypothetical protein
MKEYTHIRIQKSTKQLLDKIGKKPESYDDIVNRLIKEEKRNT